MRPEQPREPEPDGSEPGQVTSFDVEARGVARRLEADSGEVLTPTVTHVPQGEVLLGNELQELTLELELHTCFASHSPAVV